jgi:hypothetical protein
LHIYIDGKRAYIPVMMAVMSAQSAVASSAVVREPKPLGPAVPARYLSEVSMARYSSLLC